MPINVIVNLSEPEATNPVTLADGWNHSGQVDLVINGLTYAGECGPVA